MVNSEGLAMAGEAHMLAHRQNTRLLPLPPQGQACCTARNDREGRGANCAKQSQFTPAKMSAKAFSEKWLWRFCLLSRPRKTKPILHSQDALRRFTPMGMTRGLLGRKTPSRALSVDGEFLLAGVHLGLEPCHDGGVHLGDAGFGQVQGRPDLLHRHLFVVV